MNKNIQDKTLIVSESSKKTGHIWFESENVVILNFENSSKLLLPFGKFNTFILILTDVNQLRVWLNDIYLQNCWNPHGTFLIAVLNFQKATEIFEVIWTYYVINVHLILFNDNAVKVYTYYPYNTNNCYANVSSHFVFDCDETVPQNLYPEKVPNDLKGCTLKLMALGVIPYVMNTTSLEKNNVRRNGIEVVILNEMTKHLNLTTIYIPHNYSHWGIKQPNGKFSNMLALLEERQIDLVLGLAPFLPNDNEFEQLEQALLETVGWVVPISAEYPEWTNLMRIYQIDVWMFLLFCIVINSVTWWIFGRQIEFVYSFKNISLCVVNSIYIILLQGGIRAPKSVSVRILLAFWCMFSLVMYTVHQSKLVSFLTKPKHFPQITTIEELLASNLKIGFYPPSVDAFKDDPNRDKIVTNFIPCTINEGCVNRTAFTRDIATLKNRRQLMFLMKKYYTFPDGTPMVYAFKDGLFMIPKYIVVKGNPLIKKFNYIIQQLSASGIISKWDYEIIGKKNIIPSKGKTITLSIKHLLCGFMYLIVGLSLAIITFLCEIVSYKRFCKC